MRKNSVKNIRINEEVMRELSNIIRLEVKDQEVINEKAVKAAGAAGMIRPGKTSVQVVIGTQVQFVYDELKKLL